MCQHRISTLIPAKASPSTTSRKGMVSTSSVHNGGDPKLNKKGQDHISVWYKRILITCCLTAAVVALVWASAMNGGGTGGRATSVIQSWGRKSSSFFSSSSLFKGKSVVSHQYAIVIDGGSTGSRMFVYRFIYLGNGEKRDIECVSSKKVTPGLSSLDGKAEAAADYMRPLFQHATMVVPSEYQGETLVFIQATAGMRLLSEESQDAIYNSLFDQLSHDPAFPFKLLRKNIGTLSGRLEGYYAALSVNYLTGRMNTHLEPNQSHKEAVIGALDMGGSSTQIVFQHVEDNMMELDESDFWVQSYLAYGVDTIRYRLWSHLTRHVPPDGSSIIENPCGFPGHEENFKGHRLIGSGQSEQCGKQIRQMLWDEEHENCTSSSPCGLDGIRHPPLTGKFLAMSVFFFALDCMKQLGPNELPHWPSPSIDEIEHATESFCAQNWGNLNASGSHAFTRDELLPYRCVEVVYIHTLLKHGYGFPGDSRDVTFVLDIDGMEVEWTLGFSLGEVPLLMLEENVDDDIIREVPVEAERVPKLSVVKKAAAARRKTAWTASASSLTYSGVDIQEFMHQGQGLLEMAINGEGPVLIVSCFVGLIMAGVLLLSLFVRERENQGLIASTSSSSNASSNKAKSS